MIEILSLPRRPVAKLGQAKSAVFRSGLPINSLPGWEDIPLNLKLPMLKCPDNQVIFSKNKIGQSFKHLKQDFETSGMERYPEYNPLHDSNLKTFYSNERNLKRLRENGEITANNDVICNLKDFNEHRYYLHKTQLYFILQELNRLEAERHDRTLIANAEYITSRDHRHLAARQHTYSEIQLRKERLDNMRKQKYELLLGKTEEKFDRIASQNMMKKVLIEHKKILHDLKMQKHWDVSNDLQRKHLISLKKLFQFKKDRMKRNLRTLAVVRKTAAQQQQIESWTKRLNERIENQQKISTLLAEVAAQRKVFIENHRQHYQQKWDKIQEEIKQRSRKMRSLKKRRLHRKKKTSEVLTDSYKRSSYPEYQSIFDQLQETELAEALNTTIDWESVGDNMPFNMDDPIYKAAKFIMQNIIATYKKDLSDDKISLKVVAERLCKFFEEAQKFVMFRASQIIASAREFIKASGDQAVPRYFSKVTFRKLSHTIGTSSYEIHPFIDIKVATDRAPTPAGSLASIVIDSHESLVNKMKMDHLSRTDMVYMEHNIVKFKRELIVGMGKRVFAAIRCHFEKKIMDVKKDLLNLNNEFLIDQATYAILSYASNPINFESSLKLCISTLSSKIIWSLQQHLLRPERDPRGIVTPEHCQRDAKDMKMCLYCH